MKERKKKETDAICQMEHYVYRVATSTTRVSIYGHTVVIYYPAVTQTFAYLAPRSVNTV